MVNQWEALLRRPGSRELITIREVQVHGVGTDTAVTCPSANKGSLMTCYCCCPVPFDPTFSSWVAVFTVPISEKDEPLHADDLPFPLSLPLYPNKDVVMLAFVARRVSQDAPPSLYLHFPSDLEVLGPLNLSAPLWRKAEPAWSAAIKSLSIGSWLSYAFDGLWSLNAEADLSGADEDQDDAVPTFESEPLPSLTARQAADPGDADSSSTESVCDEEEDVDMGRAVGDEGENSSDEEFDYGEACEEDNEEENDEEDDKDEPDD